jgi:helicase
MKEGLPEENGLPQEVIAAPSLLPSKDGVPLLTDIQYDALAHGVAGGHSLIASAPTSTGKTLIGLWTIASSILNRGRAVYLVSHRALARQKFEELLAVLSPTIVADVSSTVVIATGDGVEDARGRRVSNPLDCDVLVATYEKFLHCLAVNGPPRDLRDLCIVCDEIQLIGDEHRGSHVELLLTLLKRAGWRQFVGLSAVLSARDTRDLGEWLGVTPLRNPNREKALRIECRTPDKVLVATADPDRGVRPVFEIAGRKSRDTIQIIREMAADRARRPIIVFCMRIDDTYALARSWMQGGAAVTVLRPPGADVGQDLLKALGYRAAYHNAELTEDERELVEAHLCRNEIDVVFSTTTLAAGVNFPLGSAIFHSWKRFNFSRGVAEPISRSEFQNMAGRVGRMGQASTEGLVIATAENPRDARDVSALMDLDAQDELVSRIGPDDFGQLLLHIFAGGLCDCREAAFQLVANTLSAWRERERNRGGLAGWKDRIVAEIDSLIHQECLVEGRTLTATMFGVSVARTGLKPATARWFLERLFSKSETLCTLVADGQGNGDEDGLSFILCHAALTCPEYDRTGGRQTRFLHWRIDQNGLAPNAWARTYDANLFTRPWTAIPAAANGALLLTAWASGRSRIETEALVNGVRLGVIQNLARDVSWILTGAAEIIGRITAPSLAEEVLPDVIRGDVSALAGLRRLARTLRRQAIRIAFGLPADVMWMAGLEQEGPRARLTRSEIIALRGAGVVTPLDLMRGDEQADQARRTALSTVGTGDAGASSRLRAAARSWKVKERHHCQKLHERRTSEIDGGDLVRRLYSAKGTGLEAVLEEAFHRLGNPLTRLDTGRVPGRPDHLLEIAELPAIVVEIKTRDAEDQFVGLGGATEVLAASELMGRGEDFCLTICSPSVDPSVPGLIEGCGRLCVVEISDLCDALVRALRGELSLTDLHNWLTTPGIAVMGDLSPLD